MFMHPPSYLPVSSPETQFDSSGKIVMNGFHQCQVL